ncbi:MAG: M23 family metallopeptidase [Verrucomicrobiales bacterium]|nr:M23 family metallopeptidase [Verrucomicrobiota bacterium JB025]
MLRTLLCLASATIGTLTAGPLNLRLPTENHHLFSAEPERFYMYVDRTFEGETSKPWQAGGYGYVRNPRRFDDQIVYTRFHEGIDISPVKRDKAGNPLDLVCSISDGTVVHTNPVAGRSNYGKYIVVEHQWENTPVYSLYAHLAEVTCKPDDRVAAGSVLGRMGYTGVGINRTRSHLHLEVAMRMSDHFNDWLGSTSNYHGNFNGMNLCGVDVARLFLAHKSNPELTFRQFIAATPAYFKVAVPAKSGTPDFLKRYPWMCKGNPQGATAWEISFSRTGLPLAFQPTTRTVDEPIVTAVRPSTTPHRYLTRNLLTGQENRASLASGGKRLVSLITGDFPISEHSAVSHN